LLKDQEKDKTSIADEEIQTSSQTGAQPRESYEAKVARLKELGMDPDMSML